MDDTLVSDPAREMPKMGLPKPKPRFTVDEYLEMERKAEERHIYLDGEIFAMAGESQSHGRVTVNLVATFVNQLKDGPCEPYTKDTKVRSGPIPMRGQSRKGLFFYPDIVVLCEEPEYHDLHTDVILNPKVIVEALSPTTEAFDRGEKFNRLSEHNPSLSDYVLVSQDKPQIEHYTREANGKWTYCRYKGLDAVVPIPSIRCELKLVEVYARVKFNDVQE
jgi:Uma2 family endonuclease